MSRQKFFIGLASVAALFLASAFSLRIPDLYVSNIVKSECKTIIKKGKVTYQKQVQLNLTTANVSHYSGQTVYYCFFNSSNTLVETATGVVGANPQVVAVSTLQDGQVYSVKPTQDLTTVYGPGHKSFTGNFKCLSKTQTGSSSGNSGTQNK